MSKNHKIGAKVLIPLCYTTHTYTLILTFKFNGFDLYAYLYTINVKKTIKYFTAATTTHNTRI